MENLEIIPERQITSDFIGECCGISFDEFKELFFFIDSLINIQLSHYHHYIKFKFTISGEDPFAKRNGYSKPYSYSKTFLVNKFNIAKIYNLSSPKILDKLVYVLYDKTGKNVLMEVNTNSALDAAFAQIEFTIADGIDRGILKPTPLYIDRLDRQLTFSLKDTIINPIIEMSVWKFIK